MSEKNRSASHLDSIVVRLQDSNLATGERERLWRELVPAIEQWAKRVALQQGWPSGEFAGSAPSHIYERFSAYDPATASFGAWCWVVLKNHLFDLARTQQRWVRNDEIQAASQKKKQEDWQSLFSQRSLFDEPFDESDLTLLATWTLSDRVCLLTLSGLWVKLPRAKWHEWCQAFGLEIPFPPDVIIVEDAPSARIRHLANLLGERPNTISKRWNRGLENLKRLNAICEQHHV